MIVQPKKFTTELTVREIIAISGWLTANAERMKTSTRVQRADAIKQAINVDCTVSQLARLEQELGFTEWVRPYGGTPRGANSNSSRTRILARAVINLRKELGLSVPRYLTALAGGRPTEDIVRIAKEDDGIADMDFE